MPGMARTWHNTQKLWNYLSGSKVSVQNLSGLIYTPFCVWLIMRPAAWLRADTNREEDCTNLTSEVPVANTLADSWEQFGHTRDWKTNTTIAGDASLVQIWEQRAGEGQSQIVGDKDRIYVASGHDRKSDDGSRKITTSLIALETSSGKRIWSYETESSMLDDQETFGGNRPTPQATPLLLNNSLICLTFTGDLLCLDTESGELVWSANLCEELHADAVQFGFSASPVRVPNTTMSFVVLAAGEEGGLHKINARTGEVIWRAPIATFSYATPVYANLAGASQWIVVSQNHVVGIGSRSGKQLWRYKLAEPGLTNVPCPLIVDGSHLVVSGQGVQGTRGLKVENENGNWRIEETWHNRRLQFFYTNWTLLAPTIAIGCTEQYLTAFDVRSGDQLGRWRGHANGNLVHFGQELLILGGNGEVRVMHLDASSDELIVDREYSVTENRCWVAPSLIDNKWFVRSGDMLQCLSFNAAIQTKANMHTVVLENQIETGSELKLSMQRSALRESDPVEQITDVFDTQGQAAALTLYKELRASKQLTDEHHIALAEAAYQMQLGDLAKLIMHHGQLDHPNSQVIKSKMAEWTGKPK